MEILNELKRIFVEDSNAASQIFSKLKNTLTELIPLAKEQGVLISYKTDGTFFRITAGAIEEKCVFTRRELYINVAHDGAYIPVYTNTTQQENSETNDPPVAKLTLEQITAENLIHSICNFSSVRVRADFNKA